MIDSFPFDKWDEKIGAFWTFGGGNSTGTYVLTVLGIILMVVSLIAWVWLEDRKLQAHDDTCKLYGRSRSLDLRVAAGYPLPEKQK